MSATNIFPCFNIVSGYSLACIIYIHNYLCLFFSDIGLGKRKSHKDISHSAVFNKFSFPTLYILTLKNAKITSTAVNQRKSP